MFDDTFLLPWTSDSPAMTSNSTGSSPANVWIYGDCPTYDLGDSHLSTSLALSPSIHSSDEELREQLWVLCRFLDVLKLMDAMQSRPLWSISNYFGDRVLFKLDTRRATRHHAFRRAEEI